MSVVTTFYPARLADGFTADHPSLGAISAAVRDKLPPSFGLEQIKVLAKTMPDFISFRAIVRAKGRGVGWANVAASPAFLANSAHAIAFVANDLAEALAA